MPHTNSTHEREDLRLLYQVTVGDLTYFKTQQWSVTNYTVLVFAALVGATQIIDGPLTTIDRGILIVLALVAAVGGLLVQHKLQKSIGVRQSRLDVVREQFSTAFHFAWAAEDKGQEYFHSIYFLRAAIVLGAVFVIWLVAFRI